MKEEEEKNKGIASVEKRFSHIQSESESSLPVFESESKSESHKKSPSQVRVTSLHVLIFVDICVEM